MAAPPTSLDERLLLDLLEDSSRALIGKLRRPVRVGIAGAQGSGKSQLAAAWARENSRVAHFSLDDVYLPTAVRKALAKDVSNLFRTRGVPGTHDLDLAKRTIAQIGAARGERDFTPLPRFDKIADGPIPQPQWPTFKGGANVILLDGWCLGATAQPVAELAEPVNQLEREEDHDLKWRTYANRQLSGPYKAFFEKLDLIVYLAAPSFEIVPQWRLEQEATTRGVAVDGLDHDVRMGIERFVLHFERLTRHMLAGGRRSEITVQLDDARRVTEIEGV